ncbi:hypothetical protein D3C76_1583540 [compost metagenome]
MKIAAKVQTPENPAKMINDKVKPILSVKGPANNLANVKHRKKDDSMPEALVGSQ